MTLTNFYEKLKEKIRLYGGWRIEQPIEAELLPEKVIEFIRLGKGKSVDNVYTEATIWVDTEKVDNDIYIKCFYRISKGLGKDIVKQPKKKISIPLAQEERMLKFLSNLIIKYIEPIYFKAASDLEHSVL